MATGDQDYNTGITGNSSGMVLEVPSRSIDKVEEFKALCEWAIEHKVRRFTFQGNEVEFAQQAFQKISPPEVKIAPEGARLLEKQKKKEEEEELLTWSA